MTNFTTTLQQISFKSIIIQNQITSFQLTKLKFYHTNKFAKPDYYTSPVTINSPQLNLLLTPTLSTSSKWSQNSPCDVPAPDFSSSELRFLERENAKFKNFDREEMEREVRQLKVVAGELEGGFGGVKSQIAAALREQQKIKQLILKK